MWSRIISSALTFLLALFCYGCSSHTGKKEVYPVNDNGLTYGNLYDVERARELYIAEHPDLDLSSGDQEIRSEWMPDLLAVVSDDGKEGYVLTEEFMRVPNSPAEAIELSRLSANGLIVYNVYDAYTMEIIGVFTEGGDINEGFDDNKA